MEWMIGSSWNCRDIFLHKNNTNMIAYKITWVKSDCRSRLKLETLDALMGVSLCRLPMENMDWAKFFDT